MNNIKKTESALDKFVEKIDVSKPEGMPEDSYKAGLAFVENGQFDDGIIEFVKIIKTVPHQEALFADAEKELKSMGFSDIDIRAIAGIPNSEENLNTKTVSDDNAQKEDTETNKKKRRRINSLLCFCSPCCRFHLSNSVLGCGSSKQ